MKNCYVILIKKKTKEDTWWLHFKSIPVNCFEEVAFLTSDGYVPYNFEEHGRYHFEESGLHVVEKKLLDELHALCPPINEFDVPIAAVFCKGSHSRPCVAFQAGGAAWDIDLDHFSPSVRVGILPPNIPAIISWVQKHKDYLLDLWPTAVETYNRYYPERTVLP